MKLYYVKKSNMNQFSKHSNNKKIRTVLFLIIFTFFSTVSGYSQTEDKNEVAINTTEVAGNAKQENTAGNSNMNFVLWFMGSKQNPNSTLTKEDGDDTKKKIMTSGIAPNRLLIKAFLKKAVNFESSLA